ncbi:hypothetical protein PQQ75_00950 [Paraburkholderia aspalathi]|jgi:hypothetical protein|uniref:hypothetical protein n=1 Tax=Paraburkholderia aspalathi TaxID=1324617 RepID=UPI0038BAAC44
MSETPKKQTFIKSIDPDQAKYWLKLFEDIRSLAHSDSLEWQLETVKHLAIINGAGLAASVAIVAADKMAPIRSQAITCIALCAFGLLLAVALMFWRWIWGTFQTRKLLLFIKAFERGVAPIEDFDALVLTGWKRIVAFGAAGLSLLLFGVSIGIVVFAVLCLRS